MASPYDLLLEEPPPKSEYDALLADAGQIEPGNIDLNNRPVVKNADGTISTVRSFSTNIDGREVLMPTVSEDGRIMGAADAINQYLTTGKHLGIFDSPDAATRYAKQLHESQAAKYSSDYDALLAPDEVRSNQPIPTALPGPGNVPTPPEKSGIGGVLSTIFGLPAKAVLGVTNTIAGSFTPEWWQNPEAFAPTDEDIRTPLVSGDTMGAVLKAPFLASGINQAKGGLAGAVRGFLEGTGDALSGFTTPESLALLPVGGGGKAAQRILAGVFEGQAILGTPEQWEAFKKAETTSEKVRIATAMGLGLAIPAAAFAHSFKGKGVEMSPELIEAGKVATEPAATLETQATVPVESLPKTAPEPGTRIAGPALVDTDGAVILQGKIGETHADLMKRAMEGPDAEKAIAAFENDAQHVFLDDQGNILSREEAAPIGVKSGQLPEGTTKVESQMLKAEPAASTRANSFQIPHEPLGTPDIVDILVENGGVKSRTGENADLWNDQPDLRGVYRQLLGGKLAPDQMAAIAAEHGFGDGSVSSFWQELDKAVQSRRSIRAQSITEGKQQSVANAKDKSFSKDVLAPDETRQEINTSNMNVGDSMTVNGEKFKVTDIDPDTLDVTLEDGKKYGVQQLKDGQAVYVDAADMVPREQDIFPAETARVEETPPRLRSGEKQGDLLSSQTEDLTLVGEKGQDFERLAAEKTAADAAKLEAEKLQASQQQEFPGNDWTEATLPSLKAEPTAAEPQGQPLGIIPPGVAKLMSAQGTLGTALKNAAGAVTKIAKFGDFRKSILKWSATNQKATGEVLRVSKELLKSVPDAARREGITNWIQAGGDMSELQQRAAATTNAKLKRGYEAAMKLTPEEIALAGKIRQTYDILLQRAKQHGIEINELPNYVNQIWRRQPIREFVASSNRRLSTSIRFAKERYYDSFFHGEQAGLKPETKDIAKLLPLYMNEVNNAIAAKQFVADMASGKASDGRPLLASTGMVQTVEGDAGKSYLVLPEMRFKENADYQALDGHPALRAWRWRAQDEEGNPILVQGDLRIHPEAYDKLKNVLGQSAIREWYRSANENPLGAIPKQITKFLVDDLNQVAKATMLGFLSPFHQVQEGTHGIGHRVNPFSGIPKIDLTKPEQFDAAQHGLMLLPDRVSANQFREGLDGSRKNLLSGALGKLGPVGETVKNWADSYQDYLFHDYIPGLKLKTYDHILPRNMDRYADQLATGEVNVDQVKYLSAQQANAAYGHLNYADIGRNPTIQHLMQMFLLAPDFLEARGRFAAQAAKGLVSRVGHEQLAALATLAVTQFVVSRVLNKTLDDDYHWDSPFDVIVGSRRYGMRSVPADIAHAFSNTRQFISGRLSPVIGRGLLEGLSGVNYRREPTTAMETVSNVITGMIPLTLQPATRGLSETGRDNPVSPMEQLLGSMGLHVSRFSPVSKVYFLSKEWVDQHGKEYGIDARKAVFPVSKFQQFRYALEDSNFQAAREEYQKLLRDQKIDPKEFEKRFKMSLHHPFTGSIKTDEAFRDSLSPADRKIYNAALERRDVLWRRYQSIR